ncbi:MAG TPA: SBBP repeat-containing protein [Fimbriimonadaceae bacterium]|nr:SBBP repeat-containing protein [Fimbriimonadaceae bacterium]
MRVLVSKPRVALVCVFVCLFGLAFVPSAKAQTQEWVARYNGPGSDQDIAQDMVVDSTGNIYVTGWSYGVGTGIDYATVKYDSSGTQMWVQRYNGPGNRKDEPAAIAVDSWGSCYVTGFSESAPLSDREDYATVKYDVAGNQVWVRRYNGPANGNDRAQAVAVDTAGNVYVTGYSPGTGNPEYTTIKYDGGGNQVWVRRYSLTYGATNGIALANALAVDSFGSVYVTGSSASSGLGTEYATVKYDSSGSQLWASRYDGAGLGEDSAYDIAVDNFGYVYVTGESAGAGSGMDYATIKYDTAGNQVWVRRYTSVGNSADEANALALDSTGNLYVTGSSANPGNLNYVTIKYDPSGTEVWVRSLDGPVSGQDQAQDIAADASGHVYVTGTSLGSGTNTDYATVKYDGAGAEIWNARYHAFQEFAQSLTVDVFGNIYVTGTSNGDGTTDYATIKYSAPNTGPSATDDGPYNLDEDGTLNVASPGVLDNDTDPENNPLTAVLVSGPAHAASFVLNSNGSFDYVPNPNFNGADSFTYRAFDGNLNSSPATVTINVAPSNDAPSVVVPGSQATVQCVALEISGISISDADAQSGQLTVQLSAAHARLSLVTTAGLTFALGDGTRDAQMTFSGTLTDLNAALASVTYEADLNFAGDDVVSISVSDNGNSGGGGPQSDADQIIVDVSAPIFEDIYPSAYEVIAGEEFMGGLSELFYSDDSKVAIFNDPTNLNAEISLDGTALHTAGCELRFTIEASVERGGIAQSVSFYNWQTQTWNFVAGTVATSSDSELELSTLLVSAYVSGNGAVRAKVAWASINDEDPAQDGWLHNVDVAKWTLVR